MMTDILLCIAFCRVGISIVLLDPWLPQVDLQDPGDASGLSSFEWCLAKVATILLNNSGVRGSCPSLICQICHRAIALCRLCLRLHDVVVVTKTRSCKKRNSRVTMCINQSKGCSRTGARRNIPPASRHVQSNATKNNAARLETASSRGKGNRMEGAVKETAYRLSQCLTISTCTIEILLKLVLQLPGASGKSTHLVTSQPTAYKKTRFQ